MRKGDLILERPSFFLFSVNQRCNLFLMFEFSREGGTLQRLLSQGVTQKFWEDDLGTENWGLELGKM